LAVFASMRNNSATADYTVFVYSLAPGYEIKTNPVIVKAAASAAPKWYYLGIATIAPEATFALQIVPSAVDASIDFDCIALVDVSSGKVVEISGAVFGSATAADILIDHNRLTSFQPSVKIIKGSDITPWSATGDLFIETDAPAIEGVALFTSGFSWRQTQSTSVRENNWVASRLPGRMTAE